MIGKHSLLVKFSGKIRFPDSASLLRDNCYRRQTTSVMMERVRFVFVLTYIIHMCLLWKYKGITGIIYKSMCAHTCVYMGWYTSVTRTHGTMVYTWDDESHYIECHESITPPAAKRLLGSLHVTPIKWVPTPICRCNAILELGFLPALGLPTPLKFCFLALVSLGCDWRITY